MSQQIALAAGRIVRSRLLRARARATPRPLGSAGARMGNSTCQTLVVRAAARDNKPVIGLVTVLLGTPGPRDDPSPPGVPGRGSVPQLPGGSSAACPSRRRRRPRSRKRSEFSSATAASTRARKDNNIARVATAATLQSTAGLFFSTINIQ